MMLVVERNEFLGGVSMKSVLIDVAGRVLIEALKCLVARRG